MAPSEGAWEGPAMIDHAEKGNIEKIVFFLDHVKGNINIKGMWNQTMLHAACTTGNLELVTLLLSRNPSLEAKTEKHATALHVASGKGHIQVMLILIQHGAIINSQTKKGATPLAWAASNGHIAAVALLMDRGGLHTIIANKETGDSILHNACARNNFEVCLFYHPLL